MYNYVISLEHEDLSLDFQIRRSIDIVRDTKLEHLPQWIPSDHPAADHYGWRKP